MVVGKGKGHMHDRQRYSEKLESIVAHFIYSKILGMVISFIHVPGKKCKTVKPLIGWWLGEM